MRQQKVGSGVITKMYEQYKVLIDSMDFQPVKMSKKPNIVFNESSKTTGVIFDIDGTLAHMGDRGPFDWDKVYKDDLNTIVFEHINFHISLGRKILLVTGRDECCRALTIEWLEMYGLKSGEYDLFMRPKDDYRKDTLVKREIYLKEIKDIYNIICVYHDRLSVLDMWGELGLFTFNVNQGSTIF